MPRLRTAALVTLGAVTGLLAFAAPAGAHVTVSSTDATQGGYGVVSFRVPTEDADATTTKVVVQFPTDTPIASASTQPIPGWTATETVTKLAKPITTDDGQVTEGVSQITWTATPEAAIRPGEFQQFNVSLGPLPTTSTITFKALQTYNNGQVVRWIETAAPGSTTEPDHPAPVLTLTPADKAADPSSGASASSQPAAASSSDNSSSNTGPVILSIVALVVALGALGLAVVGRAKGRNV